MAAILGSWKEIANYLGKGVRTVQRWERSLALPVHRPEGAPRGVVLAFPNELDQWARRHGVDGSPNGTLVPRQLARAVQTSEHLSAQLVRLHGLASNLNQQCALLAERMKRRRERQAESLQPVAVVRADGNSGGGAQRS